MTPAWLAAAADLLLAVLVLATIIGAVLYGLRTGSKLYERLTSWKDEREDKDE
jgi:FlaA1/EpsC-like NDP-sugar epimerase